MVHVDSQEQAAAQIRDFEDRFRMLSETLPAFAHGTAGYEPLLDVWRENSRTFCPARPARG
jgi:hypothetical protein